jgi:hypothetical protein
MASAESLLARQEGETVVAPVAQPAPAPGRAWFHDSELTAGFRESNREQLAAELAALADELPDADLERVVDLARRLRG